MIKDVIIWTMKSLRKYTRLKRAIVTLRKEYDKAAEKFETVGRCFQFKQE